MKLYQPVLFVGLGGTGCDIGAELERRLREEICGPDGNDFRKRRGQMSMLPYQLPSCVQFVYADMNQAELDRMRGRVVPGEEYTPAVAWNASYVTGLVPDVVSYPELAMRLRMKAGPEVRGWLPPRGPDEPTTNPLHKGAGQLPTIGRAALFGTFKDEGILPATRDLREAIGRLANSGEDLFTLSASGSGGVKPTLRGVDVFVALSVAGGTGAGIFYDYLHLIADTLKRNTALRVKIYPLVLMPSAFQEGLGGGRPAELNAGRALLDLFRLVDSQNSADADHELRGTYDARENDSEDVAVTYPGHQRIVMRPGTLQTGFLFSQPAGATREDMHRSIVSLVLSLVGTEMSQDDAASKGEHHQSFADSFVNKAADRQSVAENGIGNRGVSTALVASLTVPIDELSGIVGARLLRAAIDEISKPAPQGESNRAEMEDFLTRAGVHRLLRRQGTQFAEPEPAHGARAVTAALNDRREAMRVGIESLRGQLGRDVPALVADFAPGRAAREMLGKLDVFRLQRVVFGYQGTTDVVEGGGVSGLLNHRRGAPAGPPGFGPVPPTPPELKDRFIKKVEWNDPDVVAARNLQNGWYEWQTHVAWAHLWETHAPQWLRPMDQLKRDFDTLTRALLEFARADVEDFQRRSAELYRKRVGVSYLLPAGTGRMEQFYGQVVRRMTDQLVQARRLRQNPSAADVVKEIVGAETWAETFKISVEQSPDHAVSFLREKVKTEVQTFLRDASNGEQPMLPRLHDLLVAAAGRAGSSGPGIQQAYLDEFAGKLAGMLPATFTPQGSGPLDILINYPADARNATVEAYLKSAITLPVAPRTTEDYRPTNTESISVVLFRTGMGVTEVGEVRDVLRRWAGALNRPEPTDLLRWRQRTGYDFGYLATRETHRVRILHRLLCALWNGKATISGPEASPDRVNFELEGGVRMTLPLSPLARASSWGSLLRAYEMWALDDDAIKREFCGELMRELPRGLGSRPPRPDKLYLVLRDITEGQIELLDEMLSDEDAPQQTRAAQMRAFWVNTLTAALNQEFTGVESPVARNLRRLEQITDAGAHE
jgi:Tubulin like